MRISLSLEEKQILAMLGDSYKKLLNADKVLDKIREEVGSAIDKQFSITGSLTKSLTEALAKENIKADVSPGEHKFSTWSLFKDSKESTILTARKVLLSFLETLNFDEVMASDNFVGAAIDVPNFSGIVRFRLTGGASSSIQYLGFKINKEK